MYYDSFDETLDRCQPGTAHLLPTRPVWPRRLFGMGLLALLVLMHGCG